MSIFKIRASQLSKIMGKPKDSGGLTANQTVKLEELLAKNSKSKLVQELIEKRDRPEGLSSGAKTYAKQDLMERLYNRRREFSNKYTKKGIEVEDQSIRILSAFELEDYEKNTERRTNDYMTGEPDIITPNYIRDIKSSWCLETFPLLEDYLNPDYYYQVQVYMLLWDKQHAFVDYILTDTPWHLIKIEAYYKARNTGKDFNDVIEEVKKKHLYDDVDLNLRVKSFAVSRDYNLESRIIEKVEAVRKYQDELMEGLK